jgi:hypothetical protein
MTTFGVVFVAPINRGPMTALLEARKLRLVMRSPATIAPFPNVYESIYF